MQKELLIPAGSMESLKKAVLNGADAVYIGGKHFGARAFAKNFTEEEIIEAKSFCHLYGAKLYVTVNTMVYQSEWENVTQYINFLHRANVDALIVSDIGLISYIHETFPDLEIHASTQAHTYTVEQCYFLKELGVTRVVLDREMSLEEIEAIPNILEKEVFIHGALCVSYSGQCLMSALKGGRSGNRGSCAQVCRLPYEIYKNKVLKATEESYILSTKELNTSRNISALLNSSITSFKVEGRMKSPDYVAFITRFYRTLIDNFLINHSEKITEEDTKKLKTLFNRGFTNGYLFKEPNIMNFKTPNHQGIPIGKVLAWNAQKIKILLEEDLTQGDGIRFKEIKSGMIVNFLYDETMKLIHEAKKGSVIYVDNKVELRQKGTVLKTYDTCLTKEIEEYPSKKIPIQMIIKITEKTFSLEISDFKNTLTVNKEICEKAKTCSTTKETVLKQCVRLKDTPFFLQDIKIELSENVFIPVSKINEIRREAVANLITLRSK